MSFFGNLFGGYKNPANSAQPYLNQIPGQANQYNQPFYNAGTAAIPKLQGQYDDLLNNPGGKLNDIGQNFQQSPGFNFALQKALEGGNRAAAAGGMAGSPSHEAQNMGLATDLANQDYYNWLQGATGLYGQGLTGEQGMMNNGQNAGNNMANMIAQQLAQQAQYAYAGQQNQNQQNNSMWGNIFNGIGAFPAFNSLGSLGSLAGGGFGSSMFGGS